MHRIAMALLVREGRVLLVHRHSLRRWYPDCWDLIGGHIEPGESPEEAIRRECREELDVEIADPTAFAMAFDDPTLEIHSFVVTRWTGEPANHAPEEHDDLPWYRPEELAGLGLADPTGLPDIVRAVRAVSESDHE